MSKLIADDPEPRYLEVEGGIIEFGGTYIHFYDLREGFLYWDIEEWRESGETAQAILEAIQLAVIEGVAAVKDRLENTVPSAKLELTDPEEG